MPLSRLGLVLALALTAPLARADLMLQAPSTAITAGEPFGLTLVVTNPGDAPAPFEIPTVLPLIARADTRSVSTLFRADELAPTDHTAVPAGGFRRVLLHGSLPADFVGWVVLDAAGSLAGRVAVEVIPAAAASPGTASSTTEITAAPAQATPAPPPPRREFGLSPHDPIFFVVGGNGGLNARFQLSFKFRPIGPSDDRIAGRGFWEDTYVAYTQTSLWDLHSLSKPFTDSSYRPALFYHRYDTGFTLLGGQVGFSAGTEHESNGKGAPDSRSLNLLFARPSLRWGDADGWQFLASPKLYWYLDKSENADITRFRGYGDFHFALSHPASWKLSATFRAGTAGKGSVLLDVSYPFSRLNDIFPLGLVHGYLHLQYFNGWGESLLHYNERADAQFRIGFMAIR